MIAKLKGIVDGVTEDSAVIDVGGVETARRVSLEEQVVENADGIAEIGQLVLVDIAPAKDRSERGRRHEAPARTKNAAAFIARHDAPAIGSGPV